MIVLRGSGFFPILFGPLSLVINSKSNNSIGFSRLDTQLHTLMWRVTYPFGLLTSGSIVDSVHVVDKLRCEYFDKELEDVITSELKPKRIKYGAVVPVRIYGGNNSIARRRSYFLRIVMRHKKLEEKVNIVYSP